MKFDYFKDFYNKFYEGIHIKDELIVKQIFDYNFSSFALKEQYGKNILEDESPDGWLKYELNIYPDENLDKALFIHNLDTTTFDDSIPTAKFANDMMFIRISNFIYHC